MSWRVASRPVAHAVSAESGAGFAAQPSVGPGYYDHLRQILPPAPCVMRSYRNGATRAMTFQKWPKQLRDPSHPDAIA